MNRGFRSEGAHRFAGQDDADRWILALVGPVLAGVVDVQVHLAGVGVGELAELEVDDDQAAELAVEKIEPIPLVADAEPFLPADKREVAAQFSRRGLPPGTMIRPSVNGVCSL
jgi:hypothetical protein